MSCSQEFDCLELAYEFFKEIFLYDFFLFLKENELRNRLKQRWRIKVPVKMI